MQQQQQQQQRPAAAGAGAAPASKPVAMAVGKGPAAAAGGSNLDRLYREVVSSSSRPLSKQQVETICGVIESITLEELGVDAALGQVMTYRHPGGARELRARVPRPRAGRGTVTYLDIHDDAAVTIGIFQLPPGARMPLHDHPGMTVFSRLLYGTLHVRAYDWAGDGGESRDAGGEEEAGDAMLVDDDGGDNGGASPACSNDSSSTAEHALLGAAAANGTGAGGGASAAAAANGPMAPRPARLVTDRVLTAPADTMVLFPNAGGNIHAFTAVSACAILDVLTPPYGDRACTYYREVFPPQWMDAAGRPRALVPSEDVASWVAWRAAGGGGGGAAAAAAAAAAGEAGAVEQQQHEAVPPAPAATSSAASSASSGGGGGGGAFPAAALAEGATPGHGDIIVGLEAWKEPSDFHVARGAYRGARVTAAAAGGGGAAPASVSSASPPDDG